MLSKHCCALIASVSLVSGCGVTGNTADERLALQNAHCVEKEIRPVYMFACVSNDETACTDTEEVQVGTRLVCLVFECNEGYKRDTTEKNCVADVESGSVK